MLDRPSSGGTHLRGRLVRWFVALAATPLLVAASPAGARAGDPPSPEFCVAFSEYYAVQFLVALAESFSGLDEEENGDDAANVGTEIYLVLSPKLERATETMLDAPPPALEKGLKRQLEVWRKGTRLLRREVGLDADAIEAIAELDLETGSSDAQDVLGEDVSDKKLKAAARRFTNSVDSLEDESTRKEERALDRSATHCGVVPDPDVDCPALVTDDEATTLLGELSDTTEGAGCSWVGPDVEEGSSASLAVEVYATALAYERLTGQLAGTGEPVPDLGEEAAVFEGYSSQTLGGTCGRTVVTVVDGRTLQVALCLGDAPVSTEQVVAITTQVIDRL